MRNTKGNLMKKIMSCLRIFKRLRMVRHVRMVARIRDFNSSAEVKAACTALLHALVKPEPK